MNELLRLLDTPDGRAYGQEGKAKGYNREYRLLMCRLKFAKTPDDVEHACNMFPERLRAEYIKGVRSVDDWPAYIQLCKRKVTSPPGQADSEPETDDESEGGDSTA